MRQPASSSRPTIKQQTASHEDSNSLPISSQPAQETNNQQQPTKARVHGPRFSGPTPHPTCSARLLHCCIHSAPCNLSRSDCISACRWLSLSYSACLLCHCLPICANVCASQSTAISVRPCVSVCSYLSRLVHVVVCLPLPAHLHLLSLSLPCPGHLTIAVSVCRCPPRSLSVFICLSLSACPASGCPCLCLYDSASMCLSTSVCPMLSLCLVCLVCPAYCRCPSRLRKARAAASYGDPFKKLPKGFS